MELSGRRRPSSFSFFIFSLMLRFSSAVSSFSLGAPFLSPSATEAVPSLRDYLTLRSWPMSALRRDLLSASRSASYAAAAAATVSLVKPISRSLASTNIHWSYMGVTRGPSLPPWSTPSFFLTIWFKVSGLSPKSQRVSCFCSRFGSN